MTLIKYNTNKTIKATDKPKCIHIDCQPSIVHISGGLTSQIYVKDKDCLNISPTVFGDSYQINLLWQNNISSDIKKYEPLNPVASVNNSGLVTTTSSSNGNSEIAIHTNDGTYKTKNLSINRATRPNMKVLQGFKPGTFSKFLLDSFINMHNNRPSFPYNNINYDSAVWTGISSEDIRTINSIEQKNNFINDNRLDHTAANYVYIDKSNIPNKLLKWSSTDRNFIEVTQNDIYIVQNDGLWIPIGAPDIVYHGYTKYILNPFCYGKNFDFSGITVYNSDSDSASRRTKTGTLVTKKHMIHVRHFGYTPAINSVVRFVSKNGIIIERQIVKRFVEPNTVPIDFGVTELNEEVPEDIAVYKIIPDNVHLYSTPFDNDEIYFKNSSNQYLRMIHSSPLFGQFAISANQYKGIFNFLYTSGGVVYTSWANSRPNYLTFPTGFTNVLSYTPDFLSSIENEFTPYVIRAGDSGSPTFFVYGNELVLSGIVSGGWPSVAYINGIISNNFNSPGYQTSSPDLSSFEIFS